MNTDGSLRDWLVLVLAPRIGPATIARLLERFGSPGAVCRAGRAELASAGLQPASIDAVLQPDDAAVDAALAWAGHDAAAILTVDGPGYPPQLAALDVPPPVLFTRGDIELLADPQIAVVGSRNPTRGGIETARAFARYLAGLGVTITSGLALGIDGAAHQGALEAGRTIAVLGTGPDRVYPAAHRELARRIGEEGLLVTELPPGTGPSAANFPRRNRIISALSLGVLVVEAAPGSGSLITARYAAEQGREVFAIPGSIHNPLARGCHALIRQGAKLVDSADQIIEELGPQLGRFVATEGPAAPPATAAESLAGGLDADYRRLLDCLGHDPLAPDELIARSGLSAQNVSSMLLLLELHGYVSSHPGGRYSLTGGR